VLHSVLQHAAERFEIVSCTIASWDPGLDADDRMRDALVRLVRRLIA